MSVVQVEDIIHTAAEEFISPQEGSVQIGISHSRIASIPQTQNSVVNDIISVAKAAMVLSEEMGLKNFESLGVLNAQQWRDQLERAQKIF